MKILLVMVGKTSSGWLQKGINEYFARLKHYLPFEEQVLPDIKNAKNMLVTELKKQEGQLILKNVQPSDLVILLDEGGKTFSSRQFSAFLEKQMLTGVRRLVFVIGGAWGFSEEVYQRAGLKVSLSQMTFSHQMVRLIFAEQLYRALTILKGEPYHHD
jgi:23S rRNA (pseudouridine1915-N3)-methyltransferase